MLSEQLRRKQVDSYARGPAGDIVRKTIGAAFLETASQSGERLAVVDREQNVRLTWADYAEQAMRVAGGLRSFGLCPGDRVGVWATNCVEWVLLQFGCALAGMVLVNVNPAYRSRELSFILKASGIKMLFLREQDRRANYRSILEESCAGQELALQHVIYLASAEWRSFLSKPEGLHALDSDTPNIEPEEAANIQYTSGTTGTPKGVVLTHLNLVNNARFIGQYMRLSKEDRICLPVPLFHCFGCVIGTMTAMVTGAAVILPSPAFNARATLEAIAEERATAIYGVPAMFVSELQECEGSLFDLTSLRTGVMAGAPCPVEVMKRVVSVMHCPEIVVGYGQTESTPIITMSRVDDDVEVRCTTIGCPLPETEVRIAHRITGETVQVGEQGELLARGYMVMKGYDGEPEATRQAVDREGWLHTGDLAVMRPDGYFRITGRAKDMIIRGGENVYPREVEEVLYTHPRILDAQVIGLPDERLGETVLAWIRLKPGAPVAEEEIRAFCRDRLAYFKTPQHIRFVDDFPMTLSGKVQKFRIREFEIEQRGLTALSRRSTA
ncbi:MAG: AMP-binding protein [Bryobacteraceae bacterium]|nr:AMP-binding protein [Bryobacteraceae bacterium]